MLSPLLPHHHHNQDVCSNLGTDPNEILLNYFTIDIVQAYRDNLMPPPSPMEAPLHVPLALSTPSPPTVITTWHMRTRRIAPVSQRSNRRYQSRGGGARLHGGPESCLAPLTECCGRVCDSTLDVFGIDNLVLIDDVGDHFSTEEELEDDGDEDDDGGDEFPQEPQKKLCAPYLSPSPNSQTPYFWCRNNSRPKHSLIIVWGVGLD
ncbi:hypothetical protein JHK86_051945 [Glycine max]|nr:hypothetical protein JHK86_051945 [Glycine max]